MREAIRLSVAEFAGAPSLPYEPCESFGQHMVTLARYPFRTSLGSLLGLLIEEVKTSHEEGMKFQGGGGPRL